MTAIDNADQQAFWNEGPGRNWVTHAVELEALFAGVTEVLMRESAPLAGEAILDIGCGGGATSFAYAAAVGAAGHVLGVDISAPLLQRAADRRRVEGQDNLAFVLGDAQSHPLPAEAFDLVASRFGLMFFSDPGAAFRNIASALRPDGRMVFAAWAGPERNPWFTVPREVAMARLGAVPSPPAEAPGPMAFRDIARVIGILEAAGFSDCSGEARGVTLVLPGGVAAAAAIASRIGPASSVVREKGGGADDVEAIAAELARRFARYAGPDGARIPAEINLFRARRAAEAAKTGGEAGHRRRAPVAASRP